MASVSQIQQHSGDVKGHDVSQNSGALFEPQFPASRGNFNPNLLAPRAPALPPSLKGFKRRIDVALRDVV